ncbi:MAG: hypothetical protein GTN81_10265 [Proteobacteria bacterium]|nr:hypothetical protein [Pseudomonadota bacterium]
MVEEGAGTEQRKYERLWIESPVVYKIGRNTLTGSMVNACNEGILVESYLSSKTASKVFRILNRKPAHRLEMTYSLEGKTYLRDAEIRHFHLDYSGKDPYRLTVGFWIPKVD